MKNWVAEGVASEVNDFISVDFRTSIKGRPGYFYLFGENRDWNSRDNLKIFGKVRKFWAARIPTKQAMISIRGQQLQAFRQLMKISLVFPNLFGVKGLKTN